MNRDVDEARLRELEKKRGTALITRDQAALEDLFADDLVHIHTTGIQQNKSEIIDYAMRTLQFLSIARGDLKLRFYGNDVAVMTGSMSNTMKRDDNPDKIVSSEALVTQVWVRSGSTWKQASFHAVRAPEKTK